MKNNVVSSFTKNFHKFISKGDVVLVGVSGGPDSVALFHLLNLMKYTYKLTIYAAHFNHKLRGKDSVMDAAFVKKLAGLYGVPFIYGEKDIKKLALTSDGGTEKIAREERYKFFIENALRIHASKIAIAHNKDDNAETVLFRLISGSGAEGLSGIAPVRRVNYGEFGVNSLFLKQGKLFLVRPLIGILKKDIVDYLKQEKLSFVIDSTNNSDMYVRNKIRHNLIPSIEKDYNLSFKDALANTAGIMTVENDFMENAAKAAFSKSARFTGSSMELKISGLKSMHRAVRLRVLKSALKTMVLHQRKITSRVVSDAEECLLSGKKMSMPEGFVCEINGGSLVVHKETKEVRRVPVIVKNVPHNVIFDGAEFCFSEIDNKQRPDLKEPDHIYADLDKVVMPVTIRAKKNGDRFTPYGMTEKVRLKKYLNTSGSSGTAAVMSNKNGIIWAAGRLDDSVKITPDTKRILKVVIRRNF
jgi:tRNA(Ile)-lysidine synthase